MTPGAWLLLCQCPQELLDMAGRSVPVTHKPKWAAKGGEVGLGHGSPGLVLISQQGLKY